MTIKHGVWWVVWGVWTFICVLLLFELTTLFAFADNPVVSKKPPLISAPDHELVFSQNDKIELVVEFDVPEGYESVELRWEIEGVESSVYNGGKILAIWARPGTYRAEFHALLINWTEHKHEHLSEKFNLVVQGAQPPPDDRIDPTPSPDGPDTVIKTIGPVTSIVLRNSEELNIDQSGELAKLRHWIDQQDDSFQHFEMDIDAIGPNGEPSPVVKRYSDAVPDTSALPYGFISKKKLDGSGVILYAAEFSTAAKWTEMMKSLK